MNVYIYTLTDPRTGEVRYVGKTINTEVRLALHMCEKKNTHKNQWLAQLKMLGLKPLLQVIEIIENSDDSDWQERERFWIATYSRIAPLTNLDSGGRSGKLQSESTKEKQRAAATGRKQTPEAIAKMKATKLAGLTPERRERLRQAQLGKKQSDETKAKRASAMAGHIVSEETRRKIGEANRANYASPEIRAEMRERNLIQTNINPAFRAGSS